MAPVTRLRFDLAPRAAALCLAAIVLGGVSGSAEARMTKPEWQEVAKAEGWPSDPDSFSASLRARVSVAPPAPTETIIRIGLLGYLSCARACAARPMANAAISPPASLT